MNTPRPTIIHCVHGITTLGGIESFVMNFIAKTTLEYDSHVISLTDKASNLAQNELLKTQALDIHFIERPIWHLNASLRIAQLLRQWSNPILITHHVGPLLHSGFARCLHQSHIKQHFHILHDALHLQKPKLRTLLKLGLKFAKPQLIAVSTMVQEQLQKVIPAVHALVIMNGIDTQRFVPGDSALARAHWQLPQDAWIIGFAGRLNPAKGIDCLLTAVAQLPAHCHLAIAGSGPLEAALRDLTQQLGLTARVHFLGRVTEIISFYQALNVFCLPSLPFTEGLPLALLEAQACGIPVITSDAGNKSAVCPHSGQIVPPNESVLLADILREQATQRNAKMSPRDFVVQKFDISVMLDSYRQQFQN